MKGESDFECGTIIRSPGDVEMKQLPVAISDDPKYCFDSTKKLCQFVGSKRFGTEFCCTLREVIRLFEDHDNGQMLLKCKECLNGFPNVAKE